MATHTTPTPIPMDVKAAVETCVARLRECSSNPDAIESKLAARKHARELYSLLGDPTRDDFPDVFETAHVYGFTRQPGYTTHISTKTPGFMRSYNCESVYYHIDRPSDTKKRIIEDYYRDNWNITVFAYNVLCSKYVRHPRFPQIAVKFYVSRDVARYEYVLVEDQHDNAH